MEGIDVFSLARQKFNVSFFELLQFSKKYPINQLDLEEMIHEINDRNTLIKELRDLEISLDDIGNAFDLSKERVRQLSKAGIRRKKSSKAKPFDETRLEIWRLAVMDISWWTAKNRLSNIKVISQLKQWGYTKKEISECIKKITSENSMACIILVASHGIPEDKHREWVMQHRLQNKSQKEIWEIVNSKQPVKMTIMTWNRYSIHLGFHDIVGAQSKRFADEFNPEFNQTWHSR